MLKKLRRFRAASKGENGETLEAQWVDLGVNVDARLVPAKGKVKAVIEARDSTPPERKYLINCNPHDGLTAQLLKQGKKSLRVTLLEQVDEYDGAEKKKVTKLNMYMMTFTSAASRDSYESTLRSFC